MAKKVKPKKKLIVKKVSSGKKAIVKSEKFRLIQKIEKQIHTFRKQKYFPYLIIILLIVSIAFITKSLLFAAIVDGHPILRIKLIKELEKQSGKQTLDNLITKELIIQEAKKKNINITDDQVKSEIQRIEELLKSQGTTLDSALAMQGQTRSSLNENIKLQKTVEELLKDQVSVNEDEIKKYFEDNKQFYGKDAKYEDIKDSIAQQLSQEKLSSEFQKLIEKLKSEGNIFYLVNFN